MKFMNQYIGISKTKRTASHYQLQQQFSNNYRKVFTGSTEDAPEAALGARIKSEKHRPSKRFGSIGRVLQDVLHAGSSTSGFDFFADLPKPYNFAFSIYCRSYLSVLYASPKGVGEKAWLSGVGVGGLQWRAQFLTHLSSLTLFYQVHRHSWHWMYELLEWQNI